MNKQKQLNLGDNRTIYENDKKHNKDHVATPRWVVENIYEIINIKEFKNIWFPFISFLEERIKIYEDDIENSKSYLEHKELFNQVQNDIHTSKCIITNLKDVLDFVKGGKDE